MLTIPGAFYYSACVLVPERSEDVSSWRAHFFDVRRRFFTGVLLVVAAISLSLYFVLDVPILDPARVPRAFMIVVANLGFLIEDERVQMGLALAQLASLVLSSLLVFAPPGFVNA